MLALAKVADAVECCFYEKSAARVRSDLFDVQRRLRGQGRIRAILRPAYPDYENKSDFLAAISVLSAGGVKEMAFYNWGHVREAHLAWIKEGLGTLSETS